MWLVLTNWNALLQRSVPMLLQNVIVFKWANHGLFFVYFRSFPNKQYNFYNKHCDKSPSVYGAGIRTHDQQIASLVA